MKQNDSLSEFEHALTGVGGETFILRLYVSGATPRSTEAITKIKEICKQYLPGQHDLKVIDIYQHPRLATKKQIVAVPTLVKEAPGTLRKMIGSLSNTMQILQRLGVTIKRP